MENNGWISIGDGMPADGERVHFYSPEWDEIFVGCVHDGRWFDEVTQLDDGRAQEVLGVTHWLSWPKRPFER